MNPLENVERLRNGQLPEQVAALDKLNDFFRAVIDISIEKLKTSSQPLFIAERISKFGTLALEPLESAFAEDLDPPVKIHVAALLTQLGSAIGVESLLHEIKRAGEHQLLATISLAKAGIKEACSVIIERLSSLGSDFYTKSENGPFINTYLIALEMLKEPLPQDLRTRFTSPEVPQSIRAFIK
jgi:hypothetical protein